MMRGCSGARHARGVVLSAPTKDLDGVAALGGELKHTLVVHTGGVGEEGLVNHEAGLNGAVGEDLLLDVVNALQLVAALGLGANEGLGSGLASGGAGGGSCGSGHVGEARFSQKTGLGNVVPGLVQVAAAAALVNSVAGNEVLGGEAVGLGALLGSVGGDGEAVGENLGSRHSPARAALALVANGVDVVGPLGAGVEVGGEVLDGKVGVGNNGQIVVSLEDGSEKATGLRDGDAIKAGVVAGDVARLFGVDVGKQDVGDDGGGVQRDGAGEGGQGEERNNNFHV